MSRILTLIKTVCVVLFTCCGCAGELKTGRYVVTDVRGRTVNLKKENGKVVNGDYYFPTDTLKKGDAVKVTRVRREDRANIW